MRFRSLLLLAVLASAMPASADSVKRARYPALSPDGKNLCFSYQGDLWTVAGTGGRAERLTSHAARDLQPIYTPDGNQIVFSSNRFGNYDIFAIPTEGGVPRRLTFHSGGEYPISITPDAKWLIYYGSAGGGLDIYKMPLAGGEPIRLTWDSQESKYFGSVSPDGQWIAYCATAAPGEWRRRGYEGSHNADVWLARFTTPLTELKRVTNNPGHDFLPTFSRDGQRLFYVSDRKGAVNLWSMGLDGGSQKQLTHFTTDGVRLPSYAPRADKIAFEYNSEIWTLDLKSGKSAPVNIDVRADDKKNLVVERPANANPSEFDVSPDGKKIAIILRGDLFVMPATGGAARLLVGRPSRESHVAWLPDSKTLLFCTDEKGQKDLRTIDISGQNERPLADSPEDETSPIVSPDGRLVAYHRGDHVILVRPIGGGSPVAAIQGEFPDVSRGYTPWFDWSPDSRWVVFRQTGERLEEAIYVASLAEPQPKRVSQYFRDTQTPHFSPDGKMIYFVAAATDESNLYAIDLADTEPQPFEEDVIDRLDAPPTGGSPPPAGVRIDLSTILRRLRRVTARGGIDDATVSVNSRVFLLNIQGNLTTLPANARNGVPTLFLEGANGLLLQKDGTRVYFFSAGQINSVSLITRERRPSPFLATLTIDQAAENRQIFSEAWWLMDRYFYSEKLNDVDWKAIRTRYESLLPFVPYKDDFYDLMSEMIQELRGSHLGVTPGVTDYVADTPSSTAYLGLEPDWKLLETEHRFRVASVVDGSPAAAAWSRVNPGEYLLAVDGQPVGKEMTLDQMLDRKAGKKVVLTVNTTPSTDGARQVAIRPADPGAADDIRYEAWVAERRRQVGQLSGGKIAYLHVREMSEEAEQRFREEFVGEAADKQAMIVDVRYNGGGNIAHRLLDILRKKPYVAFQPRSLGRHVMQDWFADYIWGRPAALLINQDSASNSEMMAEGFRSLGIGPIVGVPTMGAVIATGSWRFIDGGTVRTPSTGVFTAAGENLESRGRRPDVLVPYDPIAIYQGKDPQLEAAVRLLMQSAAGPKPDR